MNKSVISVSGVSKAYQLGSIGTGTISRDVERYWARLRGKEDPFLKVGEINDRSRSGGEGVVWSLKDIDLEVKAGEAIGILGRNGAGKSTLLKILSRVTAPTTGTVRLRGRVASLLEVGTGFHPELSGRENIFLNGTILGMRRREILRCFDEIVDFSGVGRYIDTPVKRYSSGMYVRLAFAVAAHLESEILIVDEVLAVGDSEFQKKCLGKMGQISKGEGRTLLFVSHNIGAMKKLCQNGLLLSNGMNIYRGNIGSCIDRYLGEHDTLASAFFEPDPDAIADIVSVELLDRHGRVTSEIVAGLPWQIQIKFKVGQSTDGLVVAIGLTDIHGNALNTNWHPPQELIPGEYQTIFVQKDIHFALGRYFVHASIARQRDNIRFIENAIGFDIVEGNYSVGEYLQSLNYETGAVLNQMESYTTKIDDWMV